jgi:hypothetical protein
MSPDHVPDDFDWVAAQAKCSTESMFEQLRARIRADVQHRNGVFNHEDRWRFEFHDDGDEFEVVRLVLSGSPQPAGRHAPPRVTASVRFVRHGRRIHVQGEDVDVEFVAVVTLDATGQCLFAVGEVFYAEWQIRRMALEQLFFEESDDAE